MPQPGDVVPLVVYPLLRITVDKPHHLHIGSGEATGNKAVEHAVIGVVEHECEGAHLEIPCPAVIPLDMPHERSHRLAILATGQVAVKQSVAAGINAATKTLGLKVNTVVLLTHAFYPGH